MTFTLIVEQLLNGLQFGLMLFLIAAGLTLVFGVMDFILTSAGSYPRIGEGAEAQRHRRAYASRERGEISEAEWQAVEDETAVGVVREQAAAGLRRPAETRKQAGVSVSIVLGRAIARRRRVAPVASN